jgi:hypothetical protein
MSPQRDAAAVSDQAQSPPTAPAQPSTNNKDSTDALLQPATNCYNIPREKQAVDVILEGTRPEPPAPDETPRPNPDLNSQELIAHHTRPLTLQQLSAIDYIVTGRSDAEVARLLNLHRVTVTRWRLYNHVFQAELNRRRQEIWGAAADRLRATLRKALRVFHRQIASGNEDLAFRAARALLQLAGTRRFAPPDPDTAPLDPAGVLELEARKVHIELMSIDPRKDPIDDDERALALRRLAHREKRHPAPADDPSTGRAT